MLTALPGVVGEPAAVAWRDLRRVIEKAQRGAGDAHFAALLREQRAVTSAGMTRSQALFGGRIDVVRTVAESAPYSWCYLQWWRVAAYASARALLRTCMQSRRPAT